MDFILKQIILSMNISIHYIYTQNKNFWSQNTVQILTLKNFNFIFVNESVFCKLHINIFICIFLQFLNISSQAIDLTVKQLILKRCILRNNSNHYLFTSKHEWHLSQGTFKKLNGSCVLVSHYLKSNDQPKNSNYD